VLDLGEEPRSLLQGADRVGQAVSGGAWSIWRIPGGSCGSVRGSILDEWRGGPQVGRHEKRRADDSASDVPDHRAGRPEDDPHDEESDADHALACAPSEHVPQPLRELGIALREVLPDRLGRPV
jgi:hypothetical protein